MRFFQSIRWQLQFWHGLILAFVLTGLGFAAAQLHRTTQQLRMDQELERRHLVIETAMQRKPATLWNVPQPPNTITLSGPEAALFKDTSTNGYYYIVWEADSQEFARSVSAPADMPRPQRSNEASAWRWRGSRHEHFAFAPRGECALVGKDFREELDDIRLFDWLIFGTGSGILAIGLAVGWWACTRALRPIADISEAATLIANGDLTRRISTVTSKNELGQLTHVLNSTFARLDAAFTRQARFTADAAHELRTPVTVILMHTQNGMASECSSEERWIALAASQRAAQRMRRLTESLLALARLDSGKSGAAHKPCDLGQITHEVIEVLRPLAQAHELDLTAELATTPCIGNPEQLGQVITNLLTNAIHHNQPGGRVEVKVIAEPGAAILVVHDTGQGIGPEDLPHIFERFYRADKARSNAAGRAGLGLSITQAIVQAHGGTVEATSTPGQGSTFTVRLPATTSNEQ